MALLFNTLSRFVITFLPRSNYLLTSWLQSPSTVILEPKKRKSVTTFTFSRSIYHATMGPDAMIYLFIFFKYLVLSQLFHSPPSLSRGSLVPLKFLSLECYHLHIWGCWWFSCLSWFPVVTHPAQMPSRCILCQQIWETQQWPQNWTKSILIPFPKKSSNEECANHQAITLNSHVRKVMLKILHARLQHYANQEVQMSKLGLEKEEELETKLPTFSGL